MRVKLVFDSATTEEVRAACVAVNRNGEIKYPRVNVEGPTHWGMAFEMMHTNEALDIIHAVEDC